MEGESQAGKALNSGIKAGEEPYQRKEPRVQGGGKEDSVREKGGRRGAYLVILHGLLEGTLHLGSSTKSSDLPQCSLTIAPTGAEQLEGGLLGLVGQPGRCQV